MLMVSASCPATFLVLQTYVPSSPLEKLSIVSTSTPSRGVDLDLRMNDQLQKYYFSANKIHI